ncbi:MAG: hypothetical protein JW761_11870 [Prolixibacteraceae bacterium]|nr:hypothetical protein [Prolixibacteraceae bacterium]
MNRTVTTEETQNLFDFCRRHFVVHYDLQAELVDHLASSMEEQWKKNPELLFDEALQKTFKKFGITGFSKIKEQKQKELSRKYNRLLWKYLLDYFRWPKVFMTLIFTLVLSTILKMTENDLWIIAPYFGVLTVFVIYYYYKIFPKRFRNSEINGKKFLLLEQFKRVQYTSILFVQIPVQFINFRNILNVSFLQNDIGVAVISFLIIFLSIAMLGELFYVPEKIKEHFRQQFPEFAIE